MRLWLSPAPIARQMIMDSAYNPTLFPCEPQVCCVLPRTKVHSPFLHTPYAQLHFVLSILTSIISSHILNLLLDSLGWRVRKYSLWTAALWETIGKKLMRSERKKISAECHTLRYTSAPRVSKVVSLKKCISYVTLTLDQAPKIIICNSSVSHSDD